MPTDETRILTCPGLGSPAGRSTISRLPLSFQTAAFMTCLSSSGVYNKSELALSSATFGMEGGIMATYIMFSTLTDEGRKTLKERPERLREVNQEIERMGARVVNQYAVLGVYDFVNIIEAPSNEVIARISVELGARGTVQLTTLPAISIDTFTNMVKEGKKT